MLPAESHYVWKVEATDDDGSKRLVTPHGDPFEHEFPFDFLFSTAEKAEEGLDDYDVRSEAVADKWVLCTEVVTPVRQLG